MHASRRRHPTQDEGRPFKAPGLRGGSEKFAMPCLTAHGSRRFAPRSSLAYQWIRCAAKSSPRRTGLNRGFRFGFRLALTWSSPFVICRTLRRLARARCGNFARCGQQHVAADDFIADTARGRGPSRLDHRLRAEAALFRLELFFELLRALWLKYFVPLLFAGSCAGWRTPTVETLPTLGKSCADGDGASNRPRALECAFRTEKRRRALLQSKRPWSRARDKG